MTQAKMPEFVLDSSVSISWYFTDENDPYALAVLRRLKRGCAIVPLLWRLETANVLITAKRRGRITQAQSTELADNLSDLAIIDDTESLSQGLKAVLGLARNHGLTTYDAAYLELAMRLGLPIATLDRNLIKAAQKAGVDLFKAT